MIKQIWVLLLMLLSATQSISGTIDPYVSDQKYTNYGKDFVYVGKICGVYADGEKFCASAVAIDDHHILTAAHVVDGSQSCLVTFDNKEYCLSSVIVHKDFNHKKFGIADIAMGYSEKSFELKFYPKLYTETDEVGKICCMSGYGFHGTFNSGAKFYDGKKRAGSNRIDYIEKDMLICSPSTLGDRSRTSLEFLIASGDSGGGLFIDNKLAAINSCIIAVGRTPSGKYNEESGHTRISKFVPWINEHIIKK